MKSTPHFPYVRAMVFFSSALLCCVPSQLKADEPLSITAQRLDEAVDQAGEARVASEISSKFLNFAGSAENATALVTGLRDGTPVTLTTTVDNQVVTTEFHPTTRQLGYGNTFISLALAQESLAKAGITQPTAEQLIASLNGGMVMTANETKIPLTGVLTLRAAGNGWGDIAQSLGVKLGPVVQSLQAAHQRVGPPDKPVTPGKPHVASPPKIERVDRPDPAGRPVTAGHPANSHRPMLPPSTQAARPGKP